MRQQLSGATVVVITGASSGIGRATALQFARRGVRLVLASRELAGLQPVAEACLEEGARALAVETDTGDAASVRRLAARAVEAFGRIDVWVNNAGVAAFGRFADTPIEAHDQVIRTNLMGYIHGAHAAMAQFLKQDAGILINVVSLAGWAPTPLASSYTASKFGNRGFSEALRIELGGHPRIKVCDVYPAFVDTPMLEHVGNYSGRRLTPIPPVLAVDAVARKVVSLAERPRDFNPVGVTFALTVGLHSLAPRLFRWTVARGTKGFMALSAPTARTDAALFAASPRGGPTEGGLRSAPWRAAIGAACVAGTLAGALLLARRRYR